MDMSASLLSRLPFLEKATRDRQKRKFTRYFFFYQGAERRRGREKVRKYRRRKEREEAEVAAGL